MDCWDIFDNCQAFVQNGIRRFFSFSHIWIILFLVFSAFSNLYYFCWLQLISPAPASWFTPDPSLASNRVLGLALLVTSAFLKAIWVGAWVQTLFITWFCDRKWQPPRSSKNIMQVEPSNWDDARESEKGPWIPYDRDRRPRRCEVWGGCNLRISDRVYHCTRLGRCLPVYDHYCDFIKAAVYLRTIKAYLFVLVFLPLDAVFSIAIAIYALAIYQLRFAPLAILVIVAALVVVGGVAFFTWDKFWLLACKNCVYHENGILSSSTIITAKLVCISRSFTENTHGTSESGKICTKSLDVIGGSGFSSGGNPSVFPGMVVTLIEIFPTPIGLPDTGRTFSWLRLSMLLLTLLAPIQATDRLHRIVSSNRSTGVSNSARAALRHTMVKDLLPLLPTLDGVDSSSQQANSDLGQLFTHWESWTCAGGGFTPQNNTRPDQTGPG
ncbi:hypothetical protein DL770_003606 [Monosporascus sp. CRB-9-2]|nr:hypothetical protein DL770_003606 [Monosporascus sp. CRB-9-2]